MPISQRMTHTPGCQAEPGRALYEASRKNTRWYRPWDQLSAKARDNWNRFAGLLSRLQSRACEPPDGLRRLQISA